MTKKSTTKKPDKVETPAPAKETASEPVHDSIGEREYAFQTHYRDEQQRAGRYYPF